MAFHFLNCMVAQLNDQNVEFFVDTLRTYVDYLIYSENWDFLFTFARKKLVDSGHEDVFYRILEDHINQGMIQYVPADSLVIIYQDLKRKSQFYLIK